MLLPRQLAFCVATAIAIAPSAAVHASNLKIPHDWALPGLKSVNARTGVSRAYASKSQVGSSNEATADAPVPRPNETPCTDVIFNGATFADYSPHTFSYTPPASCPGPYAKIVFNGNFSVSAGVQFDRTASVEIGNVPIYFGTTAEPGSTLGPTWHVERDVTDDAALFAKPQTAEADIFNIVNSTYTGVISGTAFLQFYPARGKYAAATTPDIVLPFPGVAGGPQQLPTGTSTLSATYHLPTNIDQAFLDVYMQSQQTDEQYFLCVPNNVASLLFLCGNGPLRETEISIDGTPAGVAPVYPWIFTGGLDPYLWFPIPGVQTLEFKPYRVDLSPFAGALSNGKPHTIVLSVDNADNYFQGFATLFAFQDHHAKVVTGALTRDTLSPNTLARVTENLSGTSPSIDGSIETKSIRFSTISGFVNTSAGRVTTSINQTLIFDNYQNFANESDFTGTQTVNQATIAIVAKTVSTPKGTETYNRLDSFPLFVSLAVVLDDAGTGTQVATIDQQFDEQLSQNGVFGNALSSESNEVSPTDTLDILDDEFITGNANQSSMQTYKAFDSTGYCYGQTVAAASNVVSAVGSVPCHANDFARGPAARFSANFLRANLLR